MYVCALCASRHGGSAPAKRVSSRCCAVTWGVARSSICHGVSPSVRVLLRRTRHTSGSDTRDGVCAVQCARIACGGTEVLEVLPCAADDVRCVQNAYVQGAVTSPLGTPCLPIPRRPRAASSGRFVPIFPTRSHSQKSEFPPDASRDVLVGTRKLRSKTWRPPTPCVEHASHTSSIATMVRHAPSLSLWPSWRHGLPRMSSSPAVAASAPEHIAVCTCLAKAGNMRADTSAPSH